MTSYQHQSIMGQPYKDYLTCGHCAKEFVLENITHFIAHKSGECDVIAHSSLKTQNFSVLDTSSPLTCSLCYRVFMTARGLLQHVQVDHDVEICIQKGPLIIDAESVTPPPPAHVTVESSEYKYTDTPRARTVIANELSPSSLSSSASPSLSSSSLLPSTLATSPDDEPTDLSTSCCQATPEKAAVRSREVPGAASTQSSHDDKWTTTIPKKRKFFAPDHETDPRLSERREKSYLNARNPDPGGEADNDVHTSAKSGFERSSVDAAVCITAEYIKDEAHGLHLGVNSKYAYANAMLKKLLRNETFQRQELDTCSRQHSEEPSSSDVVHMPSLAIPTKTSMCSESSNFSSLGYTDDLHPNSLRPSGLASASRFKLKSENTEMSHAPSTGDILGVKPDSLSDSVEQGINLSAMTISSSKLATATAAPQLIHTEHIHQPNTAITNLNSPGKYLSTPPELILMSSSSSSSSLSSSSSTPSPPSSSSSSSSPLSTSSTSPSSLSSSPTLSSSLSSSSSLLTPAVSSPSISTLSFSSAPSPEHGVMDKDLSNLKRLGTPRLVSEGPAPLKPPLGPLAAFATAGYAPPSADLYHQVIDEQQQWEVLPEKSKSSRRPSVDQVGHVAMDADKKLFKSTLLKKRRYPTSRPFTCDHCDQAFNQRIHLKKHMSKHTGVKPFKCQQCSYSTVERSHLKVHNRIHTGEKPYRCTLCEYATAQNSTLKIHVKRHHEGDFLSRREPVLSANTTLLEESPYQNDSTSLVTDGVITFSLKRSSSGSPPVPPPRATRNAPSAPASPLAMNLSASPAPFFANSKAHKPDLIKTNHRLYSCSTEIPREVRYGRYVQSSPNQKNVSLSTRLAGNNSSNHVKSPLRAATGSPSDIAIAGCNTDEINTLIYSENTASLREAGNSDGGQDKAAAATSIDNMRWDPSQKEGVFFASRPLVDYALKRSNIEVDGTSESKIERLDSTRASDATNSNSQQVHVYNSFKAVHGTPAIHKSPLSVRPYSSESENRGLSLDQDDEDDNIDDYIYDRNFHSVAIPDKAFVRG